MKAKLGEIFDLQMGKTPSRKQPEYWNGTHAWVSISDMDDNKKYISDTKETITEKGIQESGIKIVPENTVLMSFKLSIGKTAITTAPIYTNEAIIAFIDKKVIPVDIDYLYHLCRGTDWSAGTNKAVKGLTLNKGTLEEKLIDLPDRATQQKRASHLNRLDSLIAQKKSQLATLDQIVKSRFVELFGDSVANPKRWVKHSLAEIADIKIGPFGSLLHSEDYVFGEHALVNPSHIINGKIVIDEKLAVNQKKFQELNAYHLMQGDVILGRRGEMGRCAVVNESGLLCGTGSLIIRPKGILKPDFIQKVISFPTYKNVIEDMAVGLTMHNLNVPLVSSFQIITPPANLQDEYYAFVTRTDTAKSAIRASISLLETLKNSLMQHYFAPA